MTRRFLPTLLALAAAGHAALPALAAGPTAAAEAARAGKLELTEENFPKLHALVGPRAEEWRHLRVHWLTDVTAARKQAAAEDKLIVVCYTGGAGYNEPLGVC